MTYDFLLLGVVRSGLLLGFALGLMSAFRKRPTVQRVIGRSALVLGALLFLVQPQLDFSRTTYMPYSTTYVSARPVVTVAAPKFSKPLPQSNFKPTERVTPATEANFELRAFDLWAIGTCAILLWTLLGTLKIRQILHRGAPLTSQGSLRIVSEPSVSTPFVAGLFRPTLFIPSDWKTTTSPEEREFVLQHERAHLSNRDLPWLYLSRLMIALCWPNPLFWLIAARLRTVSETLSDESVLAAGADPRAYAACLLNHHQRARKHAPSVAFSTVGRKSSLSRRVETIVATRPRLSLVLAARTRLVIICSVLLVSCVTAVVFGKPQTKPFPAEKLNGWYQAGYDTEVTVQHRKDSAIKDAWIVCSDPDGLLPTTSEELKWKDDRVIVKGSGRRETVGGLWVFMTNGDIAFANVWPREEVLQEVMALTTKTVSIKLVGAELPAGGVAIGVDRFFKSAPGPDQGEYGTVPDSLKSRFSSVSSDEGYVQLTGLPVNTSAFLSMRDQRYTIGDRNRQLEVNNVRSEPEAIRILPASSVSGRAVHNGRGVEGVKIVAQIQDPGQGIDTCSWGETISDSDGNFTIPQLSKGKYNVTAMLTPERGKEIVVRALEGVNVPAEGIVDGITLNFEPPTVIQGILNDDQGQAVAGVRMGIYGPSRPESGAMIQSAITDVGGRFTFHLPSGKHRLYVASGEWDMTSKQVETVLGKPTVVNFVTKRKKQEEVVSGRQPNEAELKEMNAREKIEEEERKPTPSTMSFGPGKPFYGPIKLKSGVKIKLEFMQCMDDPSYRIWQPDGTAPTAAQSKIAMPLGFKSESGEVRRMLGYISFDKKLSEFPTSIVQVPQPSSWNVYQSYGVQNDNRSINMTSFNANKTLRQTDMKFGVATGPWKVIGGITFESAGNSQRDDLRLTKIVFAPGSRTVHYALDSKWSNYDVQGRAFDFKGREYELSTYTPPVPDPKRGQLGGSLTFTGKFDPKSDLKAFNRVELIARPYEWVIFKGIKLYPN